MYGNFLLVSFSIFSVMKRKAKSEKYLVDELQMMLSAMNVEAATVDCDCIEVLRGQQKEGL